MPGPVRWASRRSAAARPTPGFWSATAARSTPSARTSPRSARNAAPPSWRATVGIGALSRGAAHAWFLERDRRALDAIRKNLAALGAERRATILAGKVLVTLDRCPAGIVFLDPPYDQQDEYTGALGLLGAHPPALTIARSEERRVVKGGRGALHRTRMVRHGDNALSFYAG